MSTQLEVTRGSDAQGRFYQIGKERFRMMRPAAMHIIRHHRVSVFEALNTLKQAKPIVPPAIQRLMNEVRHDAPRIGSYDRGHNRHNR